MVSLPFSCEQEESDWAIFVQLSSLTNAIYLSSCLHEGSPVCGLQCSGWKIHSRNKQNRLTIAQSSNDHISMGTSNFQTTWQECLKNALQEHNCNGVFVHQPMYIHSYIFIDVLIAWTKSWTEKTLLAEERGRVVRESTSFWRAHGGWLCSFVKEFQN